MAPDERAIVAVSVKGAGIFSIEIDRPRALVSVRMWGFMSAEDAQNFAEEEYKLATAAGFRTGEYVVLFRIEEAMIQPQQVIEAFQAGVATARIKARRIAVVAGRSLTRKQAERILQPRVAAVFSNALDAEEWLFSDAD